MLHLSTFQRLSLLILMIATSISSPNTDNYITIPSSGDGSGNSQQETPYNIACASWSPHGELIAVCAQKNIVFYNDKLEIGFTLKGHSKDVESVSWKADSTMLASGSNDTTIRVWDIQTHKTVNIFRGHSGEITNVRWSPKQTLIASTNTFGPTRDLLIFEPLSSTYKYNLPTNYIEPTHDAAVNTIAWSPTGEYLAVGHEWLGAGIWDIKTQKIALELAKDYIINDIAWNPDGKKIAVVGGNVGSPGYSSIWDTKTGKLLLPLQGHTIWVFSVAWSPDGTRIATSSRDQTIKIWDSSNGKMLDELSFPNSDVFIWPNSISWNPDSKRIAFTVGEEQVCIWNVQSTEQANCVEITNQ